MLFSSLRDGLFAELFPRKLLSNFACKLNSGLTRLDVKSKEAIEQCLCSATSLDDALFFNFH